MTKLVCANSVKSDVYYFENKEKIADYFKIGLSSTKTSLIEKALKESRIIMLGIRDSNSSDLENIARVINSFNPAQIQLLHESSELPSNLRTLIDPYLFDAAKSWDSPSFTKNYLNICNNEFIPLVHKAIEILKLWTHTYKHSQTVIRDVARKVYGYDHEAGVLNLAVRDVISTFKEESNKWVKNFQNSIQKTNSFLELSTAERYSQFLSSIELESVKKKIILIACVTHLTPNAANPTVNDLHKQLTNSKLNFAVLNPRINQPNQASEDEMAFLKNEYRVDKIISLINETIVKYEENKAYSPSELLQDLLKFSVFLLDISFRKLAIHQSTTQLNREILSHFKIENTSLDTQDIIKALNESNVVILGERHLMKSDIDNIAHVINSFYPWEIEVLFEGNTVSHSHYPLVRNPKLLTSGKSWDSQIAIQQHMNFYANVLLPLMLKGANLLQCWVIAKKGHASLTKERMQYLLALDPEPDVENKIFNITLETFKRAAANWNNIHLEAQKNKSISVESSMMERNKSLYASIEEASQPDKKIILIAGAMHLKSLGSYPPVDYLHKKLGESTLKLRV